MSLPSKVPPPPPPPVPPPPTRSSFFLHELVRQWTFSARKNSNSSSKKAKENHGGEEPPRDHAQQQQKEPEPLTGAAEEHPNQPQRSVRLPDPTPTTPVGLKPRRSIASLKKTLNVAKEEEEEDQQHEAVVAWGAAATTIMSPVVNTSSFYNSSTSSSAAATSAFASVGSPQSCLSGSNRSTMVAASPVLLPGRARTAVGALVAEAAADSATQMPPANLARRRVDNDVSRSPLRGGSISERDNANLLNQSLQSILPPFDDVDNYQYSGRSRRYGTTNNSSSSNNGRPISSSPMPPLFGAAEGREVALFNSVSSPDVKATFRSSMDGAPQPRRLVSDPNSIDATLSPVRVGRNSVENNRSVNNSSRSLSPLPSVAASPSSLAGDMDRRMPHRDGAESRDDYLNDDADILDGDDSSPEGFHSREYLHRDTFNPAERTFQKQKFSNQRQAHEDLIVAALERLQDEQGLVTEIQRQLGLSDCGSTSSAPTESFLSGISAETGHQISTTLVQILQELDVTEQLLFSSPSDAAAVAVPRNDFRDAIRFCLQLLRLSTTRATAATASGDVATTNNNSYPQEVSRWRLLPEIKASLGLIPESPQVVHRGGDTSVFSVPCDDSVATPMTSNVSISTTITTKTHLTAHNNRLSPGRHGHDPPPRFHHQALEVRHTIATVATLLDRMARLLTRGDKLPTQEIKRVYLEMQTLDISALKSVVESFEIDQPESLLMLLSGSASQDDSLFDVPPPIMTASNPTAVAPPPVPESVDQRQSQPDKFFSPILRSQSGNRLGEGSKEDAVTTATAGKLTGPQREEAKPRAAGRRGGGSRRGGNPFRRSTFKLQDPLNFA